MASSYTRTTACTTTAQSKGVTPSDWEKAKEGWGARIKDDRALGSKFNALYTSA